MQKGRDKTRRGDVGREGRASSGENLQDGGNRNISLSILSHTHSRVHSKNMAVSGRHFPSSALADQDCRQLLPMDRVGKQSEAC